jgi:hypothetical protein
MFGVSLQTIPLDPWTDEDSKRLAPEIETKADRHSGSW